MPFSTLEIHPLVTYSIVDFLWQFEDCPRCTQGHTYSSLVEFACQVRDQRQALYIIAAEL